MRLTGDIPRPILSPMDTTRYTTTTDFSGTLHRCNECGARSKGTPAHPRTTADVKHRETCTKFSVAGATELNVTTAQQAAARAGGVSQCGLTEDEIARAVQQGKIRASDAMNRDY